MALRRNIPLDWQDSSAVRGEYVTNVLLQQGEHEFYLMFYQAQPPVIVGELEEREKKLASLEAIPAKCVAKVIISPNRMEDIIKLLTTQLDSYRANLKAKEREVKTTLSVNSGIQLGGYLISAFSSAAQVSEISYGVDDSDLSSPEPMSLAIYGELDNSGLAIRQPLSLTLEQEEDGTYLVSDPIFGVYGEGDGSSEALRDYRSSLVDYYRLLYDHRETSLENAKQFAALAQYVKPAV